MGVTGFYLKNFHCNLKICDINSNKSQNNTWVKTYVHFNKLHFRSQFKSKGYDCTRRDGRPSPILWRASMLVFTISPLKLGVLVEKHCASLRFSPRPPVVTTVRVTLRLLTTSVSGLHKHQHRGPHDSTSVMLIRWDPPLPSLHGPACLRLSQNRRD